MYNEAGHKERYDLQRFVDAQNLILDRVRSELRVARKRIGCGMFFLKSKGSAAASYPKHFQSPQEKRRKLI